jgi:KDO2-lipid IV(A) lauroyltransferase
VSDGTELGGGGRAVLTPVKDAVMRRLIVPAMLRARPGLAYGMAERLARLRWRTAGAKRRRAERRIRELLAPQVPSHIDEVTRGLFVTQMRSRLREMPLAGMSDETFSAAVVVEGREILDEAVSQGKGVVLLGAHFGPGRLICYILRRLGYPVVRTGNSPNKDPLLGRIDEAAYGDLERRRGRRFEDVFLPDQPAVGSHAAAGRRMLAALGEGRMLYIAPDGRSIVNTVRAPLLGRPVGFSPGWHALAGMSGAPVIPSFAASRCRSASTVVRFEPPIPRGLVESADPQDAVTAFAERLEAHIRRFPCNAVFLFLGPYGRRALDSTWGHAFWPLDAGEPRPRTDRDTV